MLIDWFTVVAQTLNFLILVWLMQRFLYKPILRALDAREERIAKELADADLKKAEAQKERDEFQDKNEEFDRQRTARMSQMTDEVGAERLRRLDGARKAVDTLSAQRMESLRNDARNLSQVISRRAQQEVFAIIRKVLSDLAEASLEERMVDVFIRQLGALTDQEKAELRSAFAVASEPAVVHSAFDLPAAQRASLERVIQTLVAAGTPVRFETAPDLVSGIDFIANGRKIAWNIEAYLTSMERGLGELLEVKDTAGVTVDPLPSEPVPGTMPS